MPTNRQHLLRRYHHMYSAIAPLGRNVCSYCGLPSEQQDHVPALYWVEDQGVDYFESKGISFILVPSCAECNLTLNKQRLVGLAERAAYIRRKIWERYEPDINAPEWRPEELEALTGRLKEDMLYLQARRDLAIRRYRFAREVELLYKQKEY